MNMKSMWCSADELSSLQGLTGFVLHDCPEAQMGQEALFFSAFRTFSYRVQSLDGSTSYGR